VPEFFEVVAAQRACRAFRPDPVPDEIVEQLLEAAVRAPSAENLQPWVFLVLRDAARRAAVGDLTRELWEGSARGFTQPRAAEALFEDVERGASGGIASAPVLIVVCGDTSICHEGALAASIYPAVQSLLLAAGALGLGSALTTLPTLGPLGALLGLPKTVRPLAVVPLGWPARRLGPSRRQPMADKTHRERFGAGWR
jgi:nitroreductase